MNKVKSKIFIALLCAVVLTGALLAVGCGAEEEVVTPEPDDPEDDKYGGTLKIAIGADPSTLDPTGGISGMSTAVMGNIMERLVILDENLDFQPQLAESWEDLSDTEFVFNLRSGVEFHDGTPFDAHAVKTFFDYILDEDVGSPRRDDFDVVEKVEVIDDLTVKFHLSKPYAGFLYAMHLNGYIVSPEQLLEDPDSMDDKPIGTGPFVVERWARDDQIRLIRNENYWEPDRPFLDELVFRIIPEDSAKVMSLQTGEVHIVDNVPVRDLQELRESPDFEWAREPSTGYRSIYLNNADPPFDDIRVRQALSYAVDREALVETLTLGFGQPAYGPIAPPQFPFDPGFKPYERDLDRARELLEEAGMEDGFSFTVKCANVTEELRMMQAIQEQLEEIGVEMEIESGEYTALRSEVIDGNYEGFFAGWLGGPDPDRNIYGSFHSEGWWNWVNYSNPEVDELLEKARTELDQDLRKQSYREAEEIIAEEAAMLFLKFPYHGSDGHVVSVEVQDFNPHPLQKFEQIKEVWLED